MHFDYLASYISYHLFYVFFSQLFVLSKWIDGYIHCCWCWKLYSTRLLPHILHSKLTLITITLGLLRSITEFWARSHCQHPGEGSLHRSSYLYFCSCLSKSHVLGLHSAVLSGSELLMLFFRRFYRFWLYKGCALILCA